MKEKTWYIKICGTWLSSANGKFIALKSLYAKNWNVESQCPKLSFKKKLENEDNLNWMLAEKSESWSESRKQKNRISDTENWFSKNSRIVQCWVRLTKAGERRHNLPISEVRRHINKGYTNTIMLIYNVHGMAKFLERHCQVHLSRTR